jgi:hypothetical protein
VPDDQGDKEIRIRARHPVRMLAIFVPKLEMSKENAGKYAYSRWDSLTSAFRSIYEEM